MVHRKIVPGYDALIDEVMHTSLVDEDRHIVILQTPYNLDGLGMICSTIA